MRTVLDFQAGLSINVYLLVQRLIISIDGLQSEAKRRSIQMGDVAAYLSISGITKRSNVRYSDYRLICQVHVASGLRRRYHNSMETVDHGFHSVSLGLLILKATALTFGFECHWIQSNENASTFHVRLHQYFCGFRHCNA